jgi:hypothetical protein
MLPLFMIYLGGKSSLIIITIIIIIIIRKAEFIINRN